MQIQRKRKHPEGRHQNNTKSHENRPLKPIHESNGFFFSVIKKSAVDKKWTPTSCRQEPVNAKQQMRPIHLYRQQH